MKMGNRKVCSGATISAIPVPAAAAKTPRFRKFWPLYVIGRCGSTSCSFPNAMRLAVKVRKPSSVSMIRAVISTLVTAGP